MFRCPEIVLQRAGIAAMVGELVTTAMPPLMRSDEPLEPGRVADPCQCFADAGFRHRGLAFGLEDMVPLRGSRRSRHNAYLVARERMERRPSYRGCRQIMGRDEGRYRFAARSKLHHAHSNPPAAFY